MILFQTITISDCFWGIMWGWYQSAFAFFFTIIFSIIIMQKESISLLIMLAYCYWVTFFLYGAGFLLLFCYTYFNKIDCYALTYSLQMSGLVAFALFLFQVSLLFCIRYFYRINVSMISKTLILSGSVAAFFVHIIAKSFIV